MQARESNNTELGNDPKTEGQENPRRRHRLVGLAMCTVLLVQQKGWRRTDEVFVIEKRLHSRTRKTEAESTQESHPCECTREGGFAGADITVQADDIPCLAA